VSQAVGTEASGGRAGRVVGHSFDTQLWPRTRACPSSESSTCTSSTQVLAAAAHNPHAMNRWRDLARPTADPHVLAVATATRRATAAIQCMSAESGEARRKNLDKTGSLSSLLRQRVRGNDLLNLGERKATYPVAVATKQSFPGRRAGPP
jgi:hypothetical protein